MKIWAPIKSKHSISLSHACLVLFQLCFLNSVMGGMLLWNLSFVPALFDLLHCEKVGIRLKKEMTESTDRVKRSLKTRERYLFMKASLDSRTKFEIKTLRNLKLELCHSILTWVSQHEPLRQFEVYLPTIIFIIRHRYLYDWNWCSTLIANKPILCPVQATSILSKQAALQWWRLLMRRTDGKYGNRE